MPDPNLIKKYAGADMSMEDKICGYLGESECASFVELREILGPEAFDGTDGIEITPGSNIFIWFNINPMVADVLNHLKTTGRMHFYPTNMMTYVVDGCVWNVRLAGKQSHYRRPRWIPVCLYPGTYEERRARLAARGIRI